MNQIVDVVDLLSNADAATLTAILTAVRQILKNNDELRLKVPLFISSRGQRDRDTLGSLMRYQGPEEETVAELALNHQRWLHDPALFWQIRAVPDLSPLIPEAQIVACFIVRDRSDKWSRMVQRCACVLLAEYQSHHGATSAAMIAKAIDKSGLLPVELASVEDYITTMSSRGSYYRNLENTLGQGATLAFGTEVAETTWTRVLPKSGEKFDNTIVHLKQTALYALAQKYATLRIRLVSYQMQHLEALHEVYVQSRSREADIVSRRQQPMDGGDIVDDMMLDCVDVYNNW